MRNDPFPEVVKTNAEVVIKKSLPVWETGSGTFYTAFVVLPTDPFGIDQADQTPLTRIVASNVDATIGAIKHLLASGTYFW